MRHSELPAEASNHSQKLIFSTSNRFCNGTIERNCFLLLRFVTDLVFSTTRVSRSVVYICNSTVDL